MLKYFFIILLLSSAFCEEYKYNYLDKVCQVEDSFKDVCFGKEPQDKEMECCFGVSLEDDEHNFCFAMVNEPLTKQFVETKGNLFSYQVKIVCPSDKETTDENEEIEEDIEKEEKNENTEIENNSANIPQLASVLYFLYLFY